MNEYPKFLARKGWEDLSDSVVVHDAGEEAAARVNGYRMLDEKPADKPDHEAHVVRRGRPPKAGK